MDGLDKTNGMNVMPPDNKPWAKLVGPPGASGIPRPKGDPLYNPAYDNATDTPSPYPGWVDPGNPSTPGVFQPWSDTYQPPGTSNTVVNPNPFPATQPTNPFAGLPNYNNFLNPQTNSGPSIQSNQVMPWDNGSVFGPNTPYQSNNNFWQNTAFAKQ